MAGAMVARGRSFADVLALIEQDLGRVHADLDPEYRYRNLLAAIEAGISIARAAQHQYARLAVFAGRGTFPREAAGALWRPELADAEVGDLLAELVGRSLLTAAGGGWYTAHDLQYDVLGRLLDGARLAAAQTRLVEGYRARYPAGWASLGRRPLSRRGPGRSPARRRPRRRTAGCARRREMDPGPGGRRPAPWPALRLRLRRRSAEPADRPGAAAVGAHPGRRPRAGPWPAGGPPPGPPRPRCRGLGHRPDYPRWARTVAGTPHPGPHPHHYRPQASPHRPQRQGGVGGGHR